MADRLVVGDSPRFSNLFEVDGVPTDPTAVTLTMTDPAGTATVYTHPATLSKAGTGDYYKDLTVTSAGLWTATWVGTGVAADVVGRTYTVWSTSADPLDVLTFDEAAAGIKVGPTDVTQAARLASAVTAISRRLDDQYGPIVKRTIPLRTYTPACWDLWLDSPIYSTPNMTVTEYDTAGTAQVLTLEDFDTKPDHGYRLEARTGLGGGFKGRVRRTAGSTFSTWGTVQAVYDAGRYSSTGTVDPVFKEAATVALINWWQQVLAQAPQAGIELDMPGFRFPRFALPDAALDIVPDTELRSRLVLA